MKLRELLEKCHSMAVITGYVIRLVPKDRSRKEHISMDCQDGQMYVEYMNEVVPVSIYKRGMREFLLEIEPILNLDEEDWTLCSYTVETFERHLSDVTKFLRAIKSDGRNVLEFDVLGYTKVAVHGEVEADDKEEGYQKILDDKYRILSSYVDKDGFDFDPLTVIFAKGVDNG